MEQRMYQLTVGALLHDYGKCVHRSGLDGRAHPISGADRLKSMIEDPEILQAVRYHHKKHIKSATLPKDALAYIVYYADNVAAGHDRRDIEGEDGGFQRTLPLSSIFNYLQAGETPGQLAHPPTTLAFDQGIPFPVADAPAYEASYYNGLVNQLDADLRGIDFSDPTYVNSLLSILEGYWSYVPSSTCIGQAADISLYDHDKVTAAIAGATYQYLSAQGRQDYQDILLRKEADFRQEDAYLMIKIDISGIQKFIFTTSSTEALKNLRGRSLYLELLNEHLCDELLTACGLSRANLIYAGGGLAYLLLANTEETLAQLEVTRTHIKAWLIDQFGTELAVFFAWNPCSASQLMASEHGSYDAIFKGIQEALQHQKNHRYTAAEILRLNRRSPGDQARECRVCHRVDTLIADEEDATLQICTFCDQLRKLSRASVKPNRFFVVLEDAPEDAPALPLPRANGATAFVTVLNADKTKDAAREREGLIRIYSKNRPSSGVLLATNLWMGDYFYPSAENAAGMSTFEDLANDSTGIRRIGVLRADIDNLGQVFIQGFKNYNTEKEIEYTTLSRTATLSRAIALFFKYHLNMILGSPDQVLPFQPHTWSDADLPLPRKINVIYAGGDDLFLVGAWDEVIQAARDIREAFARYTGGALSFSAGLGLYAPYYPLLRMAEETGALESIAKKANGKNALALFSKTVGVDHRYHWSDFNDIVLGEKFQFLLTHFGEADATFAYRILQLLNVETQSSGDNHTIHLARLAYYLSQHEQKEDRLFSKTIYQWALSPEDRRALMTALNLYHYFKRQA